ncbi:C39 family peptidase [Candidatus Saccharibacteria bacterium]|nr:C39 family peptidase [Candidatus Saccharibacteria bacterium]
MVKKRTTKTSTSRRRTTKKPTRSTDLTIGRRRFRSNHEQVSKKLPRRIAIIATICLLMIVGGATVVKLLIDDTPIEKTEMNKVNQAKRIETAPKSSVELKREKTEQNLNTIDNILNDSSFSTDSIVKLKVPIYQQVYKQSCEAAALRMALAYRGIKTTDLEILELLKYNDQPAKMISGVWQWDDPHKTYVGSKNGDQTKMTGYGVFGEPIAAVSEQLGRPAVVQNDVTPKWLAQQIYAGNPVILWGISIKIGDAHWRTFDGLEIIVPMRTHTRLVIGVKGDPSQPTGFYLNDPAGTEIYWTIAQLTANVSQGIGQGVAIY